MNDFLKAIMKWAGAHFFFYLDKGNEDDDGEEVTSPGAT
jgi:hypothetical protein